MRPRWLVPLLLPLACTGAFAQDERRVASPNGELEFRLALAQPESGSLFRLAYQAFYRGKRFIDTSFLGLDIANQEPLLGENVGLIASSVSREPGRYNALTAEYMQNGSLGRRINVEVRVWDDGFAFRYHIPRSTPLEEIFIQDEVTEFDLVGPVQQARITLPFVTQQPGVGWVSIAELGAANYPRADLERLDGTILITRLARRAGSSLAFEGTTPLTCPWRVVTLGLKKGSDAFSALRDN